LNKVLFTTSRSVFFIDRSGISIAPKTIVAVQLQWGGVDNVGKIIWLLQK